MNTIHTCQPEESIIDQWCRGLYSEKQEKTEIYAAYAFKKGSREALKNPQFDCISLSKSRFVQYNI